MISVCVPTFNGAAYLRDCLLSVLRQTEPDFELLIVDDGSTDATLEIAQETARADRRVRIVRNEKRYGLAGNWNRCIELAQGEWIKFAFQDDLLAPRCLEVMIQAAETTRVPFVCCRRDFIFEDAAPEQLRQFYRESALDIDKFYAADNPMPRQKFASASFHRFRDNLVGEPTATLVHRDVFEQFGLFDVNLIMCCDFEFWNRAASNVGVSYIPETLATFRVHAKSTTAENMARRLFRMTQLDWFIVLHNVVVHPAFARLREVVAREHGANFVRRCCEQQAWLARRTLAELEIAAPEGVALLRGDWNNVARLYPTLERMASAGRNREQHQRLRKVFSPQAWRRLLRRLGTYWIRRRPNFGSAR